MDDGLCREFYQELEVYETDGVRIVLEGEYASPLQIVQAHMVCEEGSYMRDYKMDSDGDLEEIEFHNIK